MVTHKSANFTFSTYLHFMTKDLLVLLYIPSNLADHHYHTRWVCDSQKSVVCAIGIVMAGTEFRSRSTNMKPLKAGFPKLRRCHGTTSPSLANIHIISQCHQVVSVFGFSLGFSRLFVFFLSSLASGFRFLLFVFHSSSCAFSLL